MPEDWAAEWHLEESWLRAPDDVRTKFVLKFQAALASHLPRLSDQATAAAELKAVLLHPGLRTVRRGPAKGEVRKVRKQLERLATLGGGISPALSGVFSRCKENERVANIVKFVHLLQLWQNIGALGAVLDQFEKEIAAEIDLFAETGSTNWPGVWAVDCLRDLWARQTGRKAPHALNPATKFAAFLGDGFQFLGNITELHSDPASAFKRWAAVRASNSRPQSARNCPDVCSA